MESSLGCVIWSKPEDAGDWRRAPFPSRHTVKYDAFSPLQSNHQVLLRKMLQRCFNLEQEWVIVCTTQWCCQPTSPLPHSFCFLGMLISCWHYESVFWGEKNVGTCYFWNEDFMRPTEVSYPLRGQVPANMWSLNSEHHFPHVVLPWNMISSYTDWLVLSYTESKLFRRSSSYMVTQNLKVVVGWFPTSGHTRIILRAFVKIPLLGASRKEFQGLGSARQWVFFQSSSKCFWRKAKVENHWYHPWKPF